LQSGKQWTQAAKCGKVTYTSVVLSTGFALNVVQVRQSKINLNLQGDKNALSINYK
jgi:hypothetical protein